MSLHERPATTFQSDDSQWANFGLHPVMLENVRLCGYEQPTAVQSYAIPAVLANLDVIAVAQTGMRRGAWCLARAVLTKHRLWKDGSFPHSNSFQVDGQSEEAGCSSAQHHRKIQPKRGCCASRAFGSNCLPHSGIGNSNLR